MISDIMYLFFWSFSPFGEAKIAIPYAIANMQSVPTEIILLIGLLGNLLVFHIFYRFIQISNQHLLGNKLYRKGAIKLSLRARRKTKHVIGKFGAWGLMIFVMVPIPFTGAYIGTIASYIFGVNYKKSFIAISIGIVGSSIIVAYGTEFIKKMLMIM